MSLVEATWWPSLTTKYGIFNSPAVGAEPITTWENKVPNTVPARFTSYSGMDIGKDNGDVVSETYKAKAPFAFTGKIEKVVFDLAPGEKGALDHRRFLERRFIQAMSN